jgi:hypothetical protein
VAGSNGDYVLTYYNIAVKWVVLSHLGFVFLIVAVSLPREIPVTMSSQTTNIYFHTLSDSYFTSGSPRFIHKLGE